jgi:hypothetical protein
VSDTERAEFGQLVASLAVVDDWLGRTSADDGGVRPQVAAGSPLAGDDRRTAPYHVSWGAWHSLSHAVDHLHCLRSVIRDASILHIYAPYTLVRAALENAAAAVWVLHPASRDERVMRRLRLAASDLRNGSAVAEVVGTSLPRSLDERLDDLRRIARRDGLDERKAVRGASYQEIVKAIGDEGAAAGKLPLLIWKACSAVAHGDLWATINITQREPMNEAPDGIVHNRVSVNVTGLHHMTAITIAITKAGWRLYDQRSRAPY